MGWGPQHQQAGRRTSRITLIVSAVVLILLVAVPRATGLLVGVALLVGLVRVGRWWWRRADPALQARVRARLGSPGRPWRASPATRGAAAGEAARDVVQQMRGQGPGVYLGLTEGGDRRRARWERAVLILGPPRSGKTSGVIIPSLLCHPGPVVSTSTKPDVLATTKHARGELGTVWQFDPTGTTSAVDGVEVLRWSPVLCSGEWDGALLMARAMVTGAGVGTGTSDANHWTRRAQALLAPLLHAAAVGGLQIGDVVDWIARHELDQPGALITEHHGAPLAAGQLVGLQNTEARERSSIFSACADALDAYTSQAGLAAASEPNFFPGRFVTSQDTIYIHAPAEHQHLAAPLVCGLLAEIRRATYDHYRNGTLPTPVLFALDEVANIAPIAELPQIASEGASQGLLLLAALQDLSQARVRWGQAADGFLTLFGTKLLLSGIADHATLEAVSVALGEYDRQMVSHTRPHGAGVFSAAAAATGFGSHPAPARPSTTYSTQRTRVLSPGEIANLPAGHALHLDGVRWELLRLTPAHTTEPWRTLTQPTAE